MPGTDKPREKKPLGGTQMPEGTQVSVEKDSPELSEAKSTNMAGARDLRRVPTGTICVYMKSGVVFEYGITGETDAELEMTAREHMAKIWEGGYRSNVGGLVWYGPHLIDKIKCLGLRRIDSQYVDRVRGT